MGIANKYENDDLPKQQNVPINQFFYHHLKLQPTNQKP